MRIALSAEELHHIMNVQRNNQIKTCESVNCVKLAKKHLHISMLKGEWLNFAHFGTKCETTVTFRPAFRKSWSHKIRVGDLAKMVVAEWSDHRWVAAGSPGLCSWKRLSAWCGWPPSTCAASSPVLCLGLSNYPWRHCDGGITLVSHPSRSIQFTMFVDTNRGVSRSPQCRCGGCHHHTWCGRWCRTNSPWADDIAGLMEQVYSVWLVL